MKEFITLHVVYPKYRGKDPRSANEVDMKAVSVRTREILEIADAGDDDLPLAKACLQRSRASMFTTESREEILALLEAAEL